MSLSIEDFGAFFEAIHGEGIKPFEWQWRLLRRVVNEGRWPEVIAAPTGAGKTAVIDIHVFAQALCAADAQVRPPRRLALVVDRRVLVDDQYDHACDIRKLLEEAPSTAILQKVADALVALATTDDHNSPRSSLLVTCLRGGQPAPRSWRDDPLACQVICATPDMWGSRLLMGGYGSSRLARPREAGLLAYDSVVVVDEAHLCRQLLYTARRVAELAEVADIPIGAAALQVVEATATPDDARADQTVGVEAVDLVDDETLRKRLCRAKPVELLSVPSLPLKGAAIQAFADRAVELRREFQPTVGCFVNNVSTAVELTKRLGKHGTTRLVCGRMRPYDLDRIRQEHEGLLTVDGDAEVDFLVSTQSLEVGADLDWSAAVTELAPGSALAQRSGRVNRRGLRDHTRIVVAVPDKLDAKTNAPPYIGDDLLKAREWIQRRAADSQDGGLGLAPWALREDPPPSQTRRRTLRQRPELADAWLWSRTSDQLFAAPDLDLWLSDDLTADTDVGIVVRDDIPADPEDALALIQHLPPRPHEAIPASIQLARRRLPDVASLAKPIVVVRDQEPSLYTDDDPIRPGDIVVVTSDAAIFSVAGGAPVLERSGDETASDVLEIDVPVPGEDIPVPGEPGEPGEYVFRLHTVAPGDDYIRRLADKAAATAAAMGVTERQTKDGREMIAEALQTLVPELDGTDRGRVERAITTLTQTWIKDPGKAVDKDFVVETVDDESPTLIITDHRRLAGDEEMRQQWTPAAQVLLDDHADAVAARASKIAERAGLTAMAGIFELAGRHHDDGKADLRFQISLNPNRANGSVILAKSGMTSRNQIREARAKSGLSGDWRHEQLSVLACWNDLTENKPPEERDLITRLVGTSHGYGRPGFPHVTAGLLRDDKDLHDLGVALFDEGLWDHLIERTHTAYGIWGCAYLEAILRAADGQISAEGS